MAKIKRKVSQKKGEVDNGGEADNAENENDDDEDVDSVCKSGPVRSFGPKMQDRDRDRFTFVLEPKKTRPDRPRPVLVITGKTSLRPVFWENILNF